MKKRITAAAAALIIAVSVLACGGLSHASTGTDGTSKGSTDPGAPVLFVRSRNLSLFDDLYAIALGSYQNIILTPESAEQNPELDQALITLNTKLTEDALSLFKEMSDASQSAWDELPEKTHDFQYGNMDYSIKLIRCDQQVLSFFDYCDTFYTGAAHGYTGISGYNYDAASGKELTLSDVFADPSALAPVIAKGLRYTSDGSLVSENESEDTFGDVEKTIKKELTDDSYSIAWAIDQDGVTFRFAPDDLLPHAAGILESHILFSSSADLFVEGFTSFKGGYARQLTAYDDNRVDLNGDGELDSVQVSSVTSEENDYQNVAVRISVNGKELTSDASFFNLKPVLVHTEEGKNYIYAQISGDNDYKKLLVFDINGDTPVKVDEMDNTGFSYYYHYTDSNLEDSYIDDYPMLYPENFSLNSRMNILAEFSASREFKVGENGMPEATTTYYKANGYLPLSFKIDMTCDLVDPETESDAGKTVDVPAGTMCTIWCTNGFNAVDLMLDDNRIVRIYVETDWPQTVNGMRVEDVFDGTFFAG